MILFDRTTCGDLERASKLEWLETNGIGGFSSSTITGLNTRRYHGLLTAATKPPVGRFMLLSKMEETLLIDGRHYDLSSNQYPGAVYPQGHRYLKEFRLDPFPIFTYEVEGIEIEKSVFMIHGENGTVVEYAFGSLNQAEACMLELRPLIAFRDYHATTHCNEALNRSVHTQRGLASVTPYASLPTLHFAHNADIFEESGNWYFNLMYPAEQERGLDSREDLFNPFVLRYSLRGGETATVIASTSPHAAVEAQAFRENEVRRRRDLQRSAPAPNPLVQQLVVAADQFIVKRDQFNTVIAGYHWFADWGRDTMVSLPGLTLVTGRPEIARNILREFAGVLDQGMLPNRFPDGTSAGDHHSGHGAPEYNSVDSALWMFEAVRSYARYTGDEDFVREYMYPALIQIVNWYMRGTRYGICAGEDALLSCGQPGVQLTWMDAKIGDWVVTPRIGKPVEIQALWYNALCVLRDFAEDFADSERTLFLRAYAAKVRESFNAQFWNAEASCLYDVVSNEQRDGSIRPNQVFAVSLHHQLLPAERARQVVNVIERELLTPLGLRTLSRGDPSYRAHYQGDARERDSAYHQGTVWPWLMGAFLSACAKIHGRSDESRHQCEMWLQPFAEHLRAAGLGQVSEITDAEWPFEPRGCIAQAWSVAELLRAAVEDVYEIRPNKRRIRT
jgi:predicted glycogen debranching enzyme